MLHLHGWWFLEVEVSSPGCSCFFCLNRGWFLIVLFFIFMSINTGRTVPPFLAFFFCILLLVHSMVPAVLKCCSALKNVMAALTILTYCGTSPFHATKVAAADMTVFIDLLKWLSTVSLWFTWSEQPCVIHLLSQQEYLGLPWLQCRYFAMARICSMVSFDCVALFKVFVLLSTPVLCWGMSLFFHEGVILWSLSVSLSLCYSEFLVGVWHMVSNVITHRAWDEWVMSTIVLSQGVCT